MLLVCIPKLGKTCLGWVEKPEGRPGVLQKCGTESPGHILLGAKQTGWGAQGAARLQRKHCPNVEFPDALLLAPATTHHEDRSPGSWEGTAPPNHVSSPLVLSPQLPAALLPGEGRQAPSPSVLTLQGSGTERLQRPCR